MVFVSQRARGGGGRRYEVMARQRYRFECVGGLTRAADWKTEGGTQDATKKKVGRKKRAACILNRINSAEVGGGEGKGGGREP